MVKLASWCTHHRKTVIFAWVVALLAIGAIGGSVGSSYSSNFTIPNSDAQRAYDLLAKQFPQQAGDRDQIVFKTTGTTVLDPKVVSHMEATFARVRRVPDVTAVLSPYQAHGQISKGGHIAFASVIFSKRANELPESSIKEVISIAQSAERPGLAVNLGGQAIETAQKPSFGLSTGVGLIAAIAVLLITFGSLLAMGLPIVTALFGLGTGLSIVAIFTHVVETPSFAAELTAMIGLGVGIDYALFILTRFREAYATPGPSHEDVEQSVIVAMDTAGRSVLFAGTTVVIALLGMMVLGISFLVGLAIAASLGVLMMMFASLTLLPALISLAGRKLAVAGRGGPKASGSSGLVGAGTRWVAWSRFVARHPLPIALLSGAVMLTLASPALSLRLGSSDAANDPTNQTTYKAYQLLAQGFGQGFNGPLTIAAELRDPAAAAQDLQKLSAAVAPPRLSPAGDVAVLNVLPTTAPQAAATNELVEHLRKDVIPPVAASTGAKIYVGGFTAGSIDFANTLSEKLPLFIAVVVLLSALLLLVVFRSFVIPVQAAFMNLLSIGAALGVVTAIFQWGWLGGALNLHAGPVESFVPVMMFAIVFGLSMDYEVFLISRMHERWLKTDDPSRAVTEGLSLTGRVITAAATIMVCVFLSFMLGEERVIREFGLALAVAVVLDALVVRCMLLPATLDLIGRAAWWIPDWLDRRMPHLNIEGSSVALEDVEPPASAEQPVEISA